MFINHKNFKVIEVSRDRIGLYCKLEVKLPDGTLVIRWGLDHFTYKQIKNVTSKSHYDSLATHDYFELLPYVVSFQERPKSTPVYYGYLRFIQGNQARKVQFTCSELFAGNMEWFRKDVRGINDIGHLDWGNFNP